MKRIPRAKPPAEDAPRYRRPPREKLSDVAAGRVQAGPPSTPPRKGGGLEEWQDPEYFHSPEL